jgi:hypothetical protein
MRGIFCLVVGLAMAALLCQEPEFQQQYRQRLDGTIDVLQQQADRFDADAGAGALTRDQALDRLKTNPDPVASSQGAQRQSDFIRLDALKRDRADLEEPGFIHRATSLVRHLDRPLAQATMAGFVPAAPFSAEGMFFGALGFLIGLLLSGAVVGLVMLILGSTDRIRYRPKARPHRIRF